MASPEQPIQPDEHMIEQADIKPVIDAPATPEDLDAITIHDSSTANNRYRRIHQAITMVALVNVGVWGTSHGSET